MKIQDLDFEKGGGLIPVIVQDVDSKDILMFAYATKDAVERTVETGYAHYYSRSRKKLWKKGETSGNLQKVKEIWVDCDADTLLYKVKAFGPSCHTGNRTCFFKEVLSDFGR